MSERAVLVTRLIGLFLAPTMLVVLVACGSKSKQAEAPPRPAAQSKPDAPASTNAADEGRGDDATQQGDQESSPEGDDAPSDGSSDPDASEDGCTFGLKGQLRASVNVETKQPIVGVVKVSGSADVSTQASDKNVSYVVKMGKLAVTPSLAAGPAQKIVNNVLGDGKLTYDLASAADWKRGLAAAKGDAKKVGCALAPARAMSYLGSKIQFPKDAPPVAVNAAAPPLAKGTYKIGPVPAVTDGKAWEAEIVIESDGGGVYVVNVGEKGKARSQFDDIKFTVADGLVKGLTVKFALDSAGKDVLAIDFK